jgi:hypothetical protein
LVVTAAPDLTKLTSGEKDALILAQAAQLDCTVLSCIEI